VAEDLLEFNCPRCSDPVSARTYGPCQGCRDDLGRRFSAEGKEIEVTRYEPKMNVVPNQVAFKD